MVALRQTHTFAELEVSPRTYDEIAVKLRVAGYDHAFVADSTNGGIDMHGIGLTRAAENLCPRCSAPMAPGAECQFPPGACSNEP